MLFFGYPKQGPFTAGRSYHVVNRQGELTESQTFEAPYASMVHDFITTPRHVLFSILPLTRSMQ